MKISLVALLLFCLAPAGLAGEFPITVDEMVLDNGLKVFAVKRPGNPQAACVLAVRTGSAAERAGYTGIAHFLEHMLFKGTDKIGVVDPAKDVELRGRIDAVMAEILALEDAGDRAEELAVLKARRDELFAEQQENLVLNHVFKIYSDAGGSMTNAFTSNDMTAFFSILPNEKMELFFWIEAERFRHPVFRQFHSEKNVVREERRLSENRPGHDFSEEFQRVLFGSHPYAHPVIGYHEDLRRLSRKDMRAFIDTWYRPDNMFLMVAGDVESQEVFDLAKRYFGDWKNSDLTRPRIPPVPVAKAGPTRVYGAGTGAAELTVAYHLPPAGGGGDVEAEMIAMLLGDEEGRLTERLVKERKIATGVSVNFEPRLYGSVLWFTVEMVEGHAPEEAEGIVLEEVQRLVDRAPTPDTMEDLKRRYRADILGMVKSDMRIGFSFLRYEAAGSWRNIERNLVRSRTIKGEALQSLAAECLVPVNRVVGIYETKARAAAAPTARPAEPERNPSGAGDDRPNRWTDLTFKPKPIVAPSGEQTVHTLKNGMQVVAVADPDDQVFKIEAIVRGGSAEDLVGKEGTADLLARTASLSGLPSEPREAIRKKLESIVATYTVSADRFALRFSLDTFPQDQVEAINLLQVLMRKTVLDAVAFDAEREKLKARLIAAETRPNGLSSRSFRKILWGDDARTRRATQKSVAQIGARDLEAMLSRVKDPRRVILMVSGAFDVEETMTLLDATFGQWEPGAKPIAGIPTALASEPTPGLHVMDFDSSQGYVMIGARAVSRADDRYPALVMLQTILSRRIFNRIRTNEGLAYQAAAQLIPDWDVPSLCAVVFQTKNPSVPYGISLALEELQKLAAEGPTAEEMDNAVKAHGAAITRVLGRSAGRAEAFGELLLFPSVSLDWYQRVRAAVLKTTAADIQRLAAVVFARDRLAIVCVGSRAQMEAGDGEHAVTLSDFGPIQVIGTPVRDAGPETPESVVLKIMRKLSVGDVDAVEALTSGAMKERLATAEAKQQLAMQARFFAGATYEVTESSKDDDQAEVTVTVELKQGEQTMSMPLLFKLENTEGGWRCKDFRPKR